MTRSFPPLLPRVAATLAVVWFVAVVASFLLSMAGVPHVGMPARLYAPLAIVPLMLLGALATRTYGLSTRFGRAALIASLGSLAWILGDVAYTWRTSCAEWSAFACNQLRDAPAYPSIADFGYLTGPLLWSLTCVLLWRAVGIGVRDVAAYAWLPLTSVAVMVLLAVPEFVTVAGVALGRGLATAEGDEPIQVAFTSLYLLFDALMLPAAIILWHRSYGFPAFRFAALSSAALYLGDVLYTSRVGSGTYHVDADPADLLYALSIAFLLAALAAFERSGRHEQLDRQVALDRARQVQRDPVEAAQ